MGYVKQHFLDLKRLDLDHFVVGINGLITTYITCRAAQYKPSGY